MSSLKGGGVGSECRKFAPNIFNKIKCQNCFRGKDAHSNEALESNRATRKVSCCGYLFVAPPDWDFSLAANRNKRWQRRWFVLYDDGELAYSLDEHPETVPQAVVDMNRVLEVAEAEGVTGCPFALAITCPEKVHFIKGTGRDDSRRWFEVLSQFPRNTVCGKYKRNATFPSACIKATFPPSLKINETPVSSLSSVRRDTVDMSSAAPYARRGQNAAFDPGDDVYPTKDTNPSPKPLPLQDKKKQEISTPLLNESDCLRVSNSEDKASSDWRTRLQASEEKASDWRRVEGGGAFHNNPVYLMMADVPPGKKIENYENFFTREKPRMLRRQSSFGKKSELQRLVWCGEEGERGLHKSASVPNASVLRDRNSDLLSGERAQLKSSPSQIRGDPDGGNLDPPPPHCASTAEFTTDQSSEQFLKKGWLVKQQDSSSKWNKYWFVLRNSALAYFSDPIAEEAGVMDGLLDLRKVLSAQEADSSSGHTFCVTMKDHSKLYLSAVTAKIRANWIRAILQAANLDCPSKRRDCPPTEDCPPCEERKGTPAKSTHREEDAEDCRDLALPPSPPLARTAISRVKERAKTRSNSRTRSPKFAEVRESLVDSDDTTDHSSSSLPPNNATVATTPLREKKSSPSSLKDLPPKSPQPVEEGRTVGSRPERRRSFRGDFAEGRKKVTDIKDKLEGSSWTLWLDISKFCKEVECKLDDLEESKSGVEQREVGALVSSLGRVEDRLHRVHGELDKAKNTLLLRDSELGTLGKVLGCSSLQREVSRLSGASSQNALLAQQLNGAREENRRLKAEVRRSQDSSDSFELACASLRAAGEQAEQLQRSHMRLMAERVDDLTAKLLASEKAVRQLRLRVAKLEQRQERRRSSLKGKEALTLSKEYEAKLAELEKKIEVLEGTTSQEAKSASLLGRLHSLDRKVKDVTEAAAQEEEESKKEPRPPKPKIRLQVNLRESPLEGEGGTPSQQEDWNSLSLSTSMTDLTAADEGTEDPTTGHKQEEDDDEDPLSLSFGECLQGLGRRVSSLVHWLKTSLQLLYAQGHLHDAPSLDFGASGELGALVRALEFATAEEGGGGGAAGKLLYNIILLQEVTNIVFKMSDFGKYKAAVLVQHLNRVGAAIGGVERYIGQRSSLGTSGREVQQQKISLCSVVSCLLFSVAGGSLEEGTDVDALFEEVDGKRRRLASVLAEFKEKFIERFCATIVELSEDPGCEVQQGSLQTSPDPKPLLGQKQFLAHISHIISQVSQSFVSHVSRSLGETYFLSAGLQWGEAWASYICSLLRQQMSLLSSEIKSVCVRHLADSTSFSSAKCGVLVEYMHCSVAELAQIVAISTVVDGTVVLIKDAMHAEGPRNGTYRGEDSSVTWGNANLDSVSPSSLASGNANPFSVGCGNASPSSVANGTTNPFSVSCGNARPSSVTGADFNPASVACSRDSVAASCTTTRGNEEQWRAFQRSLQARAAGSLANLPQPRLSPDHPLPCAPSELGVAHRSVCSLLCFKRRFLLQQQQENKRELLQGAEHMEKGQEERGECRSCVELRQEASYLQGELEESRAAAGRCEGCQQREEQIREKDKQFEVVKEKLERELHLAQNNIKRLELHYSDEIRQLQRLYEQRMQQKNENIQRDHIQLRYSEEMEQLKGLCKRGLAAMEASHARVVQALESRHQEELAAAVSDRERALAEEAHATHLALEAVRRAHSEELQRQVQKLRDDFALRMEKRLETEALKKCYESDLSSVKCEILSMTEQYSVKCLENATLQEKLEIMNQQLKSTTTQVVELLAKNHQLESRLTSDTRQKQEEAII